MIIMIFIHYSKSGVPWDVNTWNAKILIPSNHLREIFDIFDIPFDNCFDIRCQRVVNKDVKDCPCCQQKSFDILRCQSIPILRKLLISQCITFYLSEVKWLQVCTLSYYVFISTRKINLFSVKRKLKPIFTPKWSKKQLGKPLKKAPNFRTLSKIGRWGLRKSQTFYSKFSLYISQQGRAVLLSCPNCSVTIL